jgi:hypothetical protein
VRVPTQKFLAVLSHIIVQLVVLRQALRQGR